MLTTVGPAFSVVAGAAVSTGAFGVATKLLAWLRLAETAVLADVGVCVGLSVAGGGVAVGGSVGNGVGSACRTSS